MLCEPVEVWFTATWDGSRQAWLERRPAGAAAGRRLDVLIALHGHGSDRRQYALDGRDECRAARDVAARRGMLFVAPDYRAPTSWMGPAAEADLVQIIGSLREGHRLDRVFLVGGSMGGTSALAFAAMHPDLVDGVSSQNGTGNLLEFDGFPEAIAASFGGGKAAVPSEYKRRSAEYWPERLTMPVAMTVGGQDRVVPPDSVRRLAAVLRALGRPVLLIDRPDGAHSTDYADTTAALEFVIDAARPPGSSS